MLINNINKELGEGCVFHNDDGVNCSAVQQATNAKHKLKFIGHPQWFR